jgi:hypothetical protein
MNHDDAKFTNAIVEASINLGPEVPLSELMRKQAFFKTFQFFNEAIMADPALIKSEIMLKLRRFDHFHGIFRTEEDFRKHYKFT